MSDALTQFVAWIDRTGAGKYVYGFALAFVAVWQIAVEATDKIPDAVRLWLSVFAVVVCLPIVLAFPHYRAKSKAYEQADRLARFQAACGDLGGSLSDIVRDYRRGTSRSINEGESRALCKALLARVVELARVALPDDSEGTTLRATLAVPLPNSPDLRIWCYDKSHLTRRWSVLDSLWPGAPEAYRTGNVRIVEDVTKLDLPITQGAGFKSVISFPVPARSSHNRCVGVVSIDADTADLFDVALADKMAAYIGPAAEAIGLTLSLRHGNARFTFER